MVGSAHAFLKPSCFIKHFGQQWDPAFPICNLIRFPPGLKRCLRARIQHPGERNLSKWMRFLKVQGLFVFDHQNTELT